MKCVLLWNLVSLPRELLTQLFDWPTNVKPADIGRRSRVGTGEADCNRQLSQPAATKLFTRSSGFGWLCRTHGAINGRQEGLECGYSACGIQIFGQVLEQLVAAALVELFAADDEA
jgi:hypothetical protein